MDDTDENAAIINALQRHATVVVQKSLAEGFGLTVAEAMWKSRPVVATAVGGIVDQIVHGKHGLLVEDAARSCGVRARRRVSPRRPERGSSSCARRPRARRRGIPGRPALYGSTRPTRSSNSPRTESERNLRPLTDRHELGRASTRGHSSPADCPGVMSYVAKLAPPPRPSFAHRDAALHHRLGRVRAHAPNQRSRCSRLKAAFLEACARRFGPAISTTGSGSAYQSPSTSAAERGAELDRAEAAAVERRRRSSPRNSAAIARATAVPCVPPSRRPSGAAGRSPAG